MLILLLIPILTSGYYVCSNHFYHYIRLHRFDGQLLYLKTISLGVICTIAGALILSVTQYLIGGLDGTCLRVDELSYSNPTELSDVQLSASLTILIVGWFFVARSSFLRVRHKYLIRITILFLGLCVIGPEKVCYEFSDFVQKLRSVVSDSMPELRAESRESLIWVILLTVSSWFTAYLWKSIYTIKLRLIAFINSCEFEGAQTTDVTELLKDSPMDNEMFKAWGDSTPMMFSLSNRKIYVGVICSMGEPNESEGMDQEITIIPILSGYRDKDNLNVKFTTNYRPAQRYSVAAPIIEKEENDSDFSHINKSNANKAVTLTLRQELIESVAKFNISTYKKYFERQGHEAYKFRIKR